MLRDISQLKTYIDTQIQNIENLIPDTSFWSNILSIESQDYNNIKLPALELTAKNRLKELQLSNDSVILVAYRGYETTVPETIWNYNVILLPTYLSDIRYSIIPSSYQKYPGSLRYYILKMKKKFKIYITSLINIYKEVIL